MSRSHRAAGTSRARRRMLLGRPASGAEMTAAPDASADDGSIEAGDNVAFAHELPSATGVDDLNTIRDWLAADDPLTWLFTGDSVTQGAYYTGGARNFVEHFTERVRWELRRSEDVVINTGVAGEWAAGLLDNLSHRVLRFHPDVVSVMLGLNDMSAGPAGRGSFTESLRTLVFRLRDAGCIVLLHTPGRVDMNQPECADVGAYVNIIRRLSQELDVICVDHWGHWRRALEGGRRVAEWLAADGLHPNAGGHLELVRATFRALGIFDGDSPTCRDAEA